MADCASTLVTTASCQVGRPNSGRRCVEAGELVLPAAALLHVGDLGIGAAPAVAAVVGDQPLAQRLVGDLLDGGNEGGHHRQAQLVEALLAIGREQVAADLLGEEVGLHDLGGRALAQGELLGLGRLLLVGGDVAVVAHAAEHVVAPGVGLLLVLDDVVAVRRLGQRGEIGDLRQGELAERGVEVVERGGGDAVVARAEIDLVEIELEDALLGVGLLDPEGEDRLADLAGERGLVVEQEVLGDLLGDARGAFRPLARVGEVGDDGAAEADEVDAGMGEEALVLGGDEGLQDALGHGGDGHEDALFLRVLCEKPAVGGVEARDGRRLVVGELLVVGQAVAEMPEQARHDAEAHDQAGQAKGQTDFDEIEHDHRLSKGWHGVMPFLGQLLA